MRNASILRCGIVDSWRQSTSRELGPLVVGHYSRRHVFVPGRRLGGVGAPLYLSTAAGSAWIAVWQLGRHWHAAWREYPSWWVSLFKRHENDPLKASELVAAATERMCALRFGLAYTAVDVRRVRHTRRPGYCFVKAGWTSYCSTRPFKRCRSLLILRYEGESRQDCAG
jgi:hypothetical protein